MKLAPPDLASVSARTVRMSAVALSAAVMAVLWVVIDEYTTLHTPAIVVSTVTSLVMLVAQMVDVKARLGGAEVIDPGSE